MATVTSSSIILQSITTLGGGTGSYPSSGNGFTTVTVDYGDTVVVPLQSGSTGTSAGTSNYGSRPNGNTSTGGTFTRPSYNFSATYPTLNATISNIQYDGLISFWCGPSDGGSSVGWRGRVRVIVNKDTSISLNSSNVVFKSSDTSYQNGLTGGGAGTIYYAMSSSSIGNGTNIDALRTGGDSRYVARTFTTASSKPFSTSGSGAQITNHLPTSSSLTKTVYIYGANLLGQESQYLGYSYNVTLTALAPTVTASKSIIPNGFGLTTSSSGTTSGTITYQWSTSGGGPNNKGSYSTGYTASSGLGVGVEWVGTQWTVQARATVDNGSNYVYSNTSSVTLPTYSLTGPASIQEGSSGTFSNSLTNSISSTLYWQVTPTSEFSTSNGSVASGGSVSVSPSSDGVTEGTESATFSLYINNTFNSLNLVATRTFNITDPPASVTTPGPPSVTHSNNDSQTVSVQVALDSSNQGSGGTVEFGVNTSNAAPTTWSTANPFTTTQARNTTRYYFVRRSTTNVSSSTSLTLPYKEGIIDDSIVIGTLSPTSPLAATYGDDAGENVSIPYTGGAAGDQYRIRSNDTGQNWMDTKNGASNTFSLSGSSTAGYNLPGVGQTFTYFFEGRRTQTGGADPNQASSANWEALTTGNITIARDGSIYSFDTSTATNVNESGTAVWTVNTTAGSVANGTTVGYTLSGTNVTAADFSNLSSLTGNITINNNTGTLSATLDEDTTTEGVETVRLTLANQDSAGNSTGGIYREITITDSSQAAASGGGTTVPSTSGDYGLILKNASGTTIIDESSRVSNIIDSDTYNTGTEGSSKVLFSGIDCTNPAETSFITHWSSSTLLFGQPTIGRRSSGGGIECIRSQADNSGGLLTVILIRY